MADKKIENALQDLGIVTKVEEKYDPQIQMYKEHLSLLIARGKTKEFIGKSITYSDLDRMSPKDLEKYYRLYEATQASKINQSVTNGIINAYTQICGMIIKPDDKKLLDKLNSDLKNDYLVREQLEQWTSYLSFKMGPVMPLISAAIITFENLYTINGESGNKGGEDTGGETKGRETKGGETKGDTGGETKEKTKDTKTD